MSKGLCGMYGSGSVVGRLKGEGVTKELRERWCYRNFGFEKKCRIRLLGKCEMSNFNFIHKLTFMCKTCDYSIGYT